MAMDTAPTPAELISRAEVLVRDDSRGQIAIDDMIELASGDHRLLEEARDLMLQLFHRAGPSDHASTGVLTLIERALSQTRHPSRHWSLRPERSRGR
jgi:hypothetical protein